MSKQNGGIIGPDNVTTGGPFGTASGVFKLGEVTDLIKDSKWPTAGPAGFQVANSCRFNDGSSDNLSKTFGSAGNRKTFTFSCWFKRGTITSIYNRLFSCYSDNDNRDEIYFHNTNDTLIIENVASGTGKNFVLNRVFRDVSAWYHFILAVDTTQSTESNRLKIYINGSQETSFSTSEYPSLNADWNFDNNIAHYIGRSGYSSGSNSYFDGYMAEVVFIDGQQLTPSSFGETNSQTGIWIPKDVSGLTFGTNGFYLDFKDSSALGNDAAGSNNFTANNLTSIDQSIDSCTNNFATLNPNDNFYGQNTLSEGNLKLASSTTTGDDAPSRSTIGVASGKWFWEVKVTSNSGGSNIGAMADQETADGQNCGHTQYAWAYKHDGNAANNDQNITSSTSPAFNAATYGDGDIIGVALNLDDNNIIWYKNGAVQNSGTGIAITAAASTPIGFYFAASSDNTENSSTSTHEYNFGSAAFAISSGNADANGFGNFEYAVPSGYLALCTNNLNV